MNSRRERHRDDRSSGNIPMVVLVGLCAVAMIIAGVWLGATDGADTSADAAETGETAEAAETEDAEDTEEADRSDEESGESSGSSLPEVEQSSGLTLSSVYTSTVLNPDCGNEYAEEIASLEVTNRSEDYLVRAELTATMSDGTEVHFTVCDLPSGATAEIFDTENQSIPSDVTCTALVCTSEEYIDGDVLLSDRVEITVSGSDAVITNIGGDDLTGLTVVYHCDMAGQFLGGTSYTITIDSLAAGESCTLSDDTLLGEIAVVRVCQ